MTESKKCSKCKEIKEYDHYYIRPNGIPYSQCNPCKKISSKKWYDEDMKNDKKYNIDGKSCPDCKIYKMKDNYYILEKNGQMSTYCIECELKHNIHNHDRKQTKQKWIRNNKDQVRKSQLLYHHKTRKHNIQYRLNQSLRSSMHRSLKKNDKTIELLGCSIENFKKWMTYQFDKNMSWDNYGTYWEIDHVSPSDSYNLEIREEQFKCFNWTNLRPLEIGQNRSKKNKIFEKEIFKQKLVVLIYKRQQNQIAGTS